MKENKMFSLLRKCAAELRQVQTLEESIRCYLSVFRKQLELKSIAYVVFEDDTLKAIYELSEPFDRTLLSKEAAYLLRNPEMEYKKTIEAQYVEYLYKIEDNAFLIMRSHDQNDDFFLSDVFIALVQNIFFYDAFAFHTLQENMEYSQIIDSIPEVLNHADALDRWEIDEMGLPYDNVDLESVLPKLIEIYEAKFSPKIVVANITIDSQVRKEKFTVPKGFYQVFLYLLQMTSSESSNNRITIKVKMLKVYEQSMDIQFEIEHSQKFDGEISFQNRSSKTEAEEVVLIKKYGKLGIELVIMKQLVNRIFSKFEIKSSDDLSSTYSLTISMNKAPQDTQSAFPAFNHQKIVIISKEELSQCVVGFFESMGFIITQIHHQDDYFKIPANEKFAFIAFIEESIPLTREVIYTWKKLLGKSHSLSIYCSKERPKDAKSLYDAGIDLMFTFPITQELFKNAVDSRDFPR